MEASGNFSDESMTLSERFNEMVSSLPDELRDKIQSEVDSLAIDALISEGDEFKEKEATMMAKMREYVQPENIK